MTINCCFALADSVMHYLKQNDNHRADIPGIPALIFGRVYYVETSGV